LRLAWFAHPAEAKLGKHFARRQTIVEERFS
jgi:hypothetical protein